MNYNSRAFAYRISSLTAPNVVRVRLGITSLSALDFDDFFRAVPPQPNDFIFLAPPYDSAFSTYAQAPFDRADHQRLAAFCKTTKANFMLVIKNTDFIRQLYHGFTMRVFDKHYQVSFQNRNDKEVKHLLITNY